jgi:hypothetical protein
MLQLDEPVNQPKQARRDFQSFRSEDVTKPLPDLVADRAAMGVVEL